MIFQTLDSVSTTLKKYLKVHQSAKLLTLYRLIRKRPAYSFIGCWPIITQAYLALTENGGKATLREIIKTCRGSNDPELQKARTDSQIVRNLIKEAGLK